MEAHNVVFVVVVVGRGGSGSIIGTGIVIVVASNPQWFPSPSIIVASFVIVVARDLQWLPRRCIIVARVVIVVAGAGIVIAIAGNKYVRE